jgi:hypothetical protein
MLATPDAGSTIDRFESLLGLTFTDIIESEIEMGETVDRNEVAYAEPGIEVVAPSGDEGGVSDFLEERGPGLFGLVIRVASAVAAKEELADMGVEPIAEEAPNDVKEFHYHPKDFAGVYTIITSYSHPGFK